MTTATLALGPRAWAKERDAEAIHRAIESLASWVKSEGGELSASVVDATSGVSVAGHQAQLPLNPASNMKLVTAAVALDRLGSGHRFVTGLYGSINDGRVNPLVLRGHGDPDLRLSDLWRLARALRVRGVSAVGRILVDQSLFDDQFIPPAFEQQPGEWAPFRAPVSAIALERNTITLNVLAASAGNSARVWSDPPGVTQFAGSVQTRAAGSGQAVTWDLKPSGSRLSSHLGGHVAEGMPRLRFSRRVADPRYLPGYALEHLLREEGLKTEGPVSLGGQGEKRRISYIESAPLAALTRALGKHSDNFSAEMLLKAIGLEVVGGPASSLSGAAVLTQWLKKHGAMSANSKVVNGSGLFDGNQLSAQDFTRLLSVAFNNPRYGHEFISQLAIGGVDGTLRSRFRKFADSGRIRAKTGTLNRVVSLSGFVLGEKSPTASAFSFLVNGIAGKAWAIRKRIDTCVDAIAESS